MSADAERICLQCGLCCNGVIFANGQLQAGDNAARLAALGLRLKARRASQDDGPNPFPKFSQPCAAFAGCKCTIYGERPAYCRQFECALLKNVLAGRRKPEAALRIIGVASRRAAGVKRLLRQLGDTNEDVALGVRFRRLSARMHDAPPAGEAAGKFADLSVAIHRLLALISAEFYPGSES